MRGSRRGGTARWRAAVHRDRDRPAVLLPAVEPASSTRRSSRSPTSVMALGLNIVVGFAGLLDLGYVAFYALGAYSLGWLGSGFFFKAHVHVLVSPLTSTLAGVHLNFVLILIGAVIIASLAGMLIGLPTLRLRGDYIAIVTLALRRDHRRGRGQRPEHPRFGGGQTLTAGNLGITRRRSRRTSPGIGTFGLLAPETLVLADPRARLLVACSSTCGCATRGSAAPGSRCARTRSRPSRWGSRWCKHQAARLRHRRRVRRHVRRLPRRLLQRGQRRPVRVRLLDLRARDGDRRRARLDLGRDRSAALLLSYINYYLIPEVLNNAAAAPSASTSS